MQPTAVERIKLHAYGNDIQRLICDEYLRHAEGRDSDRSALAAWLDDVGV
jgi:hypothetical protein